MIIFHKSSINKKQVFIVEEKPLIRLYFFLLKNSLVYPPKIQMNKVPILHFKSINTV